MPNFGLFGSKCLTVMPRHAYIQTYIFTNQNIYLKCVGGSNSLGTSVIYKYFFFVLIIYTHQWEEA